MLSIDFPGKTTLVVGGTRGTGAAIVRGCAVAGSNVVWTCLDHPIGIEASEALLSHCERLGIKCFYRKVDCTDEERRLRKS